MSRFWTRNFASRNDSRAGIAPANRDVTPAAGGGAVGVPPGGGAGGCDPPAGGVGAAGTAGQLDRLTLCCGPRPLDSLQQ